MVAHGKSFLLAITCLLFSSHLPLSRQMAMLQALEDEFYAHCPLAASNNLPMELGLRNKFAEPLEIQLWVILHRLVEVNDLDETMSLFLEVWMDWNLPCPNNLSQTIANGTYSSYGSMVELTKNETEMWRPKLTHINAASDANPFRKLQTTLSIYPLADPKPYGEIGYIGMIETACDTFSFAKFPFDTLKCPVELEFASTSELLVFSKNVAFVVDTAAELVGETDIWSFVPPLESEVRHVTRSFNLTYHNAKLSLTLKRKCQYFVGNIFLPLICLVVLQIFALFMEPGTPDRPTFCMTVVLAFAVVLSMVFDSIPQTSEEVYLVSLVETTMAVCVLLTIYTLIVSSYKGGQWFRKTITVIWCFDKKITLVRLFDVLAGLVAIFIVTAATSVYFSKVTLS